MKRVTFAAQPTWHIIKEGEEHRKAREPYMEPAQLDIIRFRQRIIDIGKILIPHLIKKHGSHNK